MRLLGKQGRFSQTKARWNIFKALPWKPTCIPMPLPCFPRPAPCFAGRQANSKGSPCFPSASPRERIGLPTPIQGSALVCRRLPKFFVFELNFDPLAGSTDHLKRVPIESSQQPPSVRPIKIFSWSLPFFKNRGKFTLFSNNRKSSDGNRQLWPVPCRIFFCCLQANQTTHKFSAESVGPLQTFTP